jgi:hypothetical protein
MGWQIEDGHGTGATVKVVGGDKLYVKAVTSTREHEVNHDDGQAYHIPFSQSPSAADDCIFYMKNTAEGDMVIEGIGIGVVDCTADDSIYFKVGGSGTRNDATALIPANVNEGSGNSAEGTFEKGVDLDGVSATFAGATEMDRVVFAGITDVTSFHFNFPQDVIIQKNRVFTIWVGGSATGTYYLTVYFNYHEKS